MICPDCLESYEFIKYEVDEATLEHRGLFRCGCKEPTLFPEFMARELVNDDELLTQLRISRLLHLRQSLPESAEPSPRRPRGNINLHSQNLIRYLQDFTEKSIRILK